MTSTDNPLVILRNYAARAPESFPIAILFSHSDENLVVFDMFPKARFHFLVLPRIRPAVGLDASRLHNLRTLLKGDKQQAHQVLLDMQRDAEKTKQEIEEEMVRMYKHKWPVWMGFHAEPSMHHLHLHIISGDLVSRSLKHKKHYNSFHPTHGYFLHLEDVMSWFESDDAFFKSKVRELTRHQYADLLKQDLVCFHCERDMKNMPQLKEHLENVIKKSDDEGLKRWKLQKAREQKRKELADKKAKEAEAAASAASTLDHDVIVISD